MGSNIIRAAAILIALLPLQSALAADYSNSWILPAYAAGHEPEVDFSGSVRPPIFTFFPPMAGWCEGRTANIGLPLVYDLGELQPAPVVHFLAQPALNEQVTAERVRVCLSGFSTLPPEHESRTIHLVNIVNSQQSALSALRMDVSSLTSQVSSLREQISSLQSAVSQALAERAALQGQLGAAISQLSECRTRNQSLNGEVIGLRSELAAAESKSKTCSSGQSSP